MTLDAAATKLIDSGVLGALLIIALCVIAYLFKALINEKDKEILGKEQTNIVLTKVNDTMRELMVEIEKRPYDDPTSQKPKTA